MSTEKYQEFNNVVREKYSNLQLTYRGINIAKYHNEEFEQDNGAHSRLVTFINEPTATEVGFDAAEEMTGFIQIGIFLPTSDKGLNFSLNDMARQVNIAFPRSDFVSGGLKVEWLNVQREQPIRVGGHYTVTMRVNFRVFSC